MYHDAVTLLSAKKASKNSSYDRIVNATITPYFLLCFLEKKKSCKLENNMKKKNQYPYKLGICMKFWDGSQELPYFSGVSLKEYLADQGSFNL